MLQASGTILKLEITTYIIPERIDKNTTFKDFFISGISIDKNIAYSDTPRLLCTVSGKIDPTKYPSTVPPTQEAYAIPSNASIKGRVSFLLFKDAIEKDSSVTPKAIKNSHFLLTPLRRMDKAALIIK
ncbi:hypothetical protein SDC9_148067 [bioreactor metagenome]|uniref:Uncharacterized protein n=1 Tax=bioreactor metagenome TaxID=1076179 RepID=A0A645EI99_9ZZZZ